MGDVFFCWMEGGGGVVRLFFFLPLELEYGLKSGVVPLDDGTARCVKLLHRLLQHESEYTTYAANCPTACSGRPLGTDFLQ